MQVAQNPQKKKLNSKRKLSLIISIADFLLIIIVLTVVMPKIQSNKTIDYKEYQLKFKAVEFSEKTLIELTTKQTNSPSSENETISLKFFTKDSKILLHQENLELSSANKNSVDDFVIEQTGLKTIKIDLYKDNVLIKSSNIKVRN